MRPVPLRVLVVEDAVDQALLMRETLASAGFAVESCQDGDSALQVWNAGDFDVVITDLNLPALDGFELTRRLKAADGEATVIAVTGHVGREYIESAYRAGVDALLHKPLGRDALLRRLREMFPSATADSGTGPVLAVGAFPGDVEFGCGATLLRHLELGRDVVVALWSGGPHGTGGTRSARRAAEDLGVRIEFADAAETDPPGTGADAFFSRLREEVRPNVVYMPAADDQDPRRRALHEAAVATLGDVRAKYGYLTPTAADHFDPAHFELIGPRMARKLAAMVAYAELGQVELTGRFVHDTARWWGRHREFAEVEPFEEIRVRD